MRKKVFYVLFSMLFAALYVNVTAQGIDPGTTNLAHSWKFNDGTANDAVGGANGTLMGGAEVADGSLFVINTGSYLELPPAQIGINTYDELSAEIWFRSVPQGNTSYHMICYFGNTTGGVGDNGFFISPARGDNKSRFAISCGNTTAPYGAETGVDGPEYDDGELHYMVGTLTSTDIGFFIDGVSMGTAVLSPANSIINVSTNEAFLSKSGYTGDVNWVGEILEFNIWSKALTADEVTFLYAKGAAPVGIRDASSSIPKDYRLLQNYPNPFNPTTTIEFALPHRSNVHLVLVDMMGKVVRDLANGEFSEGTHTVRLDASDLASGVYFCRMHAGNFVDGKKLVLVK